MPRPLPLLVLALGLFGCTPADDCEGGGCGCLELSDDGICCEGFLTLGDGGRCEARPWPPTERFALGAPGADAIEVGVDGLGRALVSWQRRDPDPQKARSTLAEQTADGWRTHALGNPELGFGARATLATRGLEAWVTWSQHRTLDDEDVSTVHLLRRDSRGRWMTDDDGEQISFAPKAYEPRPLLPSTGEGLVVWNQWRSNGGYGVALGRTAPGETTLVLPDSSTDVLSPLFFFSNAPQIAVGTNGDGVITWYQATPAPGVTDPTAPSDGLRLFISERFRVDGTFSRPGIEDWLSPDGPPIASHEVRNPVVAVGEFGEALVFWSQEHPSGKTGLYMASRGSLPDIGADDEWTTPANADDTFGPLREDAACIEVVIASTREAHVTWFDGPPGATTVYAAHRDATGAWDTQLELSTPGRAAQNPRLAVGPDGEAAVVWTERGEDERWRVMGRRRGPLGTAWGEAVELSTAAEGDAVGPAIAIGPDGTLVAAWTVGPLAAQTVSVAILP